MFLRRAMKLHENSLSKIEQVIQSVSESRSKRLHAPSIFCGLTAPIVIKRVPPRLLHGAEVKKAFDGKIGGIIDTEISLSLH